MAKVPMRTVFLSGCSVIAALAFSQAVAAQEASSGVEDIIVTAQKRQQSMQDVPIAVSALSQSTLETNRITSVTDLATTTPNLEVRNVSGGTGIPVFAMRGAVSYGSVPGQDKSISLYLDGVYIGSSQGSAFELPDLERIEVLRGPQGTLFGRNSTAGAVSVITRDPSGKFGARQVFTIGNYDQLRSSTRVEFPISDSFSGSVSYTHDERTGDMKNLGAGQVWDRTGSYKQGIQTSPKTLGDKNSESVFAALKFDPGSNFTAVYKFDWMENHFTPEGTALTAFTPGNMVPSVYGEALAAAYANPDSNPGPIAGAHRPKAVNNFYSTPGYQRVQGHSLTATIEATDKLSFKNIFAYRKSFIVASADLTGAGALVVNKAAADGILAAYNTTATNPLPAGSFDGLIGSPYVAGGSTSSSYASQYSDELQANYNSRLLTLTAGAMWFHIKTRNGSPADFDGTTQALEPIPGGVLARNLKNYALNTAESMAVYLQAEFHVTPELDIVGGYRLTHDNKNGISYVDNTRYRFTYLDTRPSYMGGVNYRPINNVLMYAKYSTGYVSGGAVYDIPFAPETVKSWEGGIKADLFGRMLRTNLAVFKSDYKNLQTVTGGAYLSTPRRELSTIILREGDLNTKGFEFEATVAPVAGLTLNGSVGYTDVKMLNANPQLGGEGRQPTLRPKWTANVSAQYESMPLFGNTTLLARLDGSWRSKVRTLAQADGSLPADYDSIYYSPAGWVLNGRIALQHLEFGSTKVGVALWGRNLTDQDRPMFPIYFQYLGSTTYERARTYGIDLSIEL